MEEQACRLKQIKRIPVLMEMGQMTEKRRLRSKHGLQRVFTTRVTHERKSQIKF